MHDVSAMIWEKMPVLGQSLKSSNDELGYPTSQKVLKNIESISKKFLKHTVFRINTYMVLHR